MDSKGWKHTVYVAIGRLIIIPQTDKCFQVDIKTKKIDMLQKSGHKRSNFGVYHKYGEKYIYVVGGQDTLWYENLNTVQKFDVHQEKWENAPNLNHKRFAPGLFMSKDNKHLYAFGGKTYSIEKLDLTKNDAKWTILNINIPFKFANKSGFSAFPIWNHKTQTLDPFASKVLIFGGYNTKACIFDIKSEELLVSEDSSYKSLKSLDMIYLDGFQL